MDDWFSVLDRIEDFNLKGATSETWESWHKQFQIILRTTAFEKLPNSRRVALLLAKLKGFMSVLKALDIDDATIDYDKLVSELGNYFNPVNARMAFYSRSQKINESFNSFAAELKALSGPCQFRDPNIVRDMFIYNMNEKHVEVAFLIGAKYDPSLEEAVALANAFGGYVENGVYSQSSVHVTPPSSVTLHVTAPPIRMMPITAGTHKVEVLFVLTTEELVFVSPTSMMNPRNVYIDSFQGAMKKCQEDAVVPVKNGRYAALVNSKWYRVVVLSIENGRKATVSAMDFGWERTISFSVFRNLPLDFRVAEPLVWKLRFRYNYEFKRVWAKNVVTLDLKIYKNQWEACLTKPQPSASDSSAGLHNKSREEGRSFQRRSFEQRDGPQRPGPGLSSPPDNKDSESQDASTASIEKDSKHGQGAKRPGKYTPTSSDTDFSERDNKKEQNNTRAKGFKQSPGPSGSVPESRQQSSRNSNTRKRQPVESDPTFSSEDAVTESNDKGSNGTANGQEHSAFARYPQDARESSRQSRFVPRPVEMSQTIGTRTHGTKPPTELHEPCPVPLDSFTMVNVVHKSPEGKIFCVRKNLENELRSLNEELSKLPSTLWEPVFKPQEGDLVMTQDEYNCWYRAEILEVHPDGLRVKLKVIDIGSVVKARISEICVLPPKFWCIKPFAFPIEVTKGADINEDDDVLIMPIKKSEEGVWKVNIKKQGLDEPVEPELSTLPAFKPVAAQPAPKSEVSQRSVKPVAVQPYLKPSSVRSRPTSRGTDAPRPPRPPPIPRNTFSKVKIVHIGPEGTFGMECSKLPIIGDLQNTIEQLTHERLRGPPEVGGLYLAPFDDRVYRARLLSLGERKTTCNVTFVDFGNESEIPIKDLYLIPEELMSADSYTFKIRIKSQVPTEIGDVLDVSPIVREADGSWLVQLKGEPSSPQHALPVDDDVSFSI